MAHIEKLRDGRTPVLGACLSMKIHNNQRSDGVGGGWDVAEETRPGGTCGGGHLPVVWGGRIEGRKNKNRLSFGALIFDGFQWMGGYINILRVGSIDGIYSGERVCRTLTMGVDAVALFLLSS